MKDYSVHRDAAIAWLNGRRDFNKGIEVLKDSGFRPVVVKVLARQGAKAPAAMQRLVSIMRDLVQAWAQPETAHIDTNVELAVVNGKEVGAEQDINGPNSIFEAYEKADELPPSVSDIVRNFRNAYMLRDKLHRQLAEVGEKNDEESVTQRKALSDAIKVQSDLMDKLYPFYAKFVETGELPQISEVEDKADESKKRIDIEGSASDLSAMSKEELQRVKKSLATKVLRARNMLLYQTEVKGDVENPIPEDDLRRTKYESKIARLSKRIEEIDKQIALLA